MLTWRKWIKKFLLIGILCNLLTCVYAQTSTQLTDIKLSINSDKQTVLTLKLKGKTAYHIFTLHKPERLVVDLANTKLAVPLDHVELNNPNISSVRQGKVNGDTLRLVFDLNIPQQVRTVSSTPLPHQSGELSIALQGQGAANSIAAQTKSTNLANASSKQKATDATLQQTQAWVTQSLPTDNTKTTQTKQKSKTSTVVAASASSQPAFTKRDGVKAGKSKMSATNKRAFAASSSKRLLIVVIDPGHGGKDPGTTGPRGTHEKDIVLAISKELQRVINQQPGFRAVLTRNRDYFIPLRQRLAIARKDKADVFIAIHADAYQDPFATGASVFALSQHGASSEAARWLAQKENYSEVGDVDLNNKSDVLRSVLIDLSQTATITTSLQLGGIILQQLDKVGHLHHSYVEQAPFMVLKSPDIPSLLIETGFLSNPEEEYRLRDAQYQHKLAIAISNGIKTYFSNNPPSGTLLAYLHDKGSDQDDND